MIFLMVMALVIKLPDDDNDDECEEDGMVLEMLQQRKQLEKK